jgi:hypothetical protein
MRCVPSHQALGMGLVPVRLAVYLAIVSAGLYAVLRIFDLYLEAPASGPFSRWAAWVAISPYLHLACAISSISIYCCLVVYFEKRPVSELTGPRPGQTLVAGLLLGMGLVAIYYAMLMLLGNAVIHPTHPGHGRYHERRPDADTGLCGDAAPVVADRTSFRLEFYLGGTIHRPKKRVGYQTFGDFPLSRHGPSDGRCFRVRRPRRPGHLDPAVLGIGGGFLDG